MRNFPMLVAALAIAGSAQAATTISSTNGPDAGPLAGQVVTYNFESGAPAGLTGNYTIATGSASGLYAAPLGDTTHYLVVPGAGASGSATLNLGLAYKSLSFYWGSIDTYNTVEFFDAGGVSLGSFTGSAVPPAPADGSTGSALNNRRVNFDFGGALATKVTFTSTSQAFELDDIAGSAVPEPATWAMLIMGMSMVGVSVRRRRYLGSVAA